MSTHNGVAFHAFVYDLLYYCLPRYGLEWEELNETTRRTAKVFREEFGQAVILFRERHANEFKERIAVSSDLNSIEDVYRHLINFCKRTFKGNIPLMELFVFCAFLLDLGIYCLRKFEPDLFIDVIDDIPAVFDNYVRSYFTVVGGWYALYQVAAQYMCYVQLATNGCSSATPAETLAATPKV